MMRTLKFCLAAGSLLAIVGLAEQVQAAPLAPNDNCKFAASLEGGGLLSNYIAVTSTGEDINQNWTSGFGDAAANFTCNGFGAQIDAAILASRAPLDNTATLYDTNKHLGGELFWRDRSTAALGVAASNIERDFTIVDAGGSSISDENIWRVGGFGQYFMNDKTTIGGGIYYLSGNMGGLLTLSGFEANADLKFYPTDSLAFDLRGDLLNSSYTGKFFDASFNGYAATARAEYKVSSLPVSLFAGARYISHTSASQTVQSFTISEMQGFLGARIDFGSAPYHSLRERDRNGTFDNTSVMQETAVGAANMLGF
jgi:hypothetical protein